VLAVAGWIHRGQQNVIEYLVAENRVLREVRVHALPQARERAWPRDLCRQAASVGGNSDGGVVPWS
jgi:hypothetical protein